jgi:crotonobetainyl-CoA:carnitine CoA-transferase CaiB-like acyl-CoA transferase
MCIDHDVPVATAFSARDIFADPHIAARGDLIAIEDPVLGPLRQQAPFPRVVGEPIEAPAGAPELGADTRAVLADVLGLSAGELDELAELGTI